MLFVDNLLNDIHKKLSDVMWALRRLKSPAPRIFVQQLVQVNNEEQG